MGIGCLCPKLVTIAIPAFKRTFLAEAIESALAQDYPNIELVIVNDKSPYNLDEVVNKYTDTRIRYFVNERNLGKESIVLNWNRCVDYARGEFFVLLCDDDVLMPNFVSELLKLAEKYPQCDVFHGRRMVKDELKTICENDDLWPEWESFDSFLVNALKGQRVHTVTEFMYRTARVKSIKYDVYPVGYFSDNASVLKFGKEGGFVSSDKMLCVFRRSREHITGRSGFAVEKALAAIQYFNWLDVYTGIFPNKMKINETIDAWVYEWVYKPSNVWERIKLIIVMPLKIWKVKQKIYMLLHVTKRI